MFTRHDQTVDDCLEVLEIIADTGVTHMGFKDVGVDRETLDALSQGIRAAGATSYMEVVSTTVDDCLNSARTAVGIGVDRLLGGSDVAPMLDILEGSGIAYYPFPGRPQGHPTRLGGSPADIAADCRRIEAQGCAGVDLLAYRAVDAEPMELVRAAREAVSGDLIVAGSIASAERIAILAEVGVDAFTIGSAAFDGSFSPSKGSLRSQLRDILAACS